MPPTTPAHEPGAINALVDNHRRFLAFLERRVGNRDVAEEILQSAFVRGLERAGEIRDEERAVAWFYRLLRNAVVDHWRARGGERAALETLAHELADASEPPPEIAAELCRCFEALLPTLPVELAAMIRQVDLEGKRVVDAAAAEGVSANLAGVRLHRARRALRDGLTASCKSCAEHGCLDCSCGRQRPVTGSAPQSCH